MAAIMSRDEGPSESLELVFLGTSGGIVVPAFFCSCTVCEELRRDGVERTRASLAVVGREITVIDATPTFEIQMERQRIPRVDRIFITHWHYDHVWGLGSLAELRSCAKWPPVQIYLSEEIAFHFDRDFAYLGRSVQLHPFQVGDRIELPDAVWEVVRTRHSDDSVGFIVHAARTFAYLVGVVPPAPTVERLHGVDLLIQEATLDELDEDWTDFSLGPAVDFWQETGIPECILTHFSCHSWRDRRLIAGLSAAERQAYADARPGLRFAHDGMRLGL
jgi:phosphoribosyl 1,2-cyclic phosphate phosphodiesterase